MHNNPIRSRVYFVTKQANTLGGVQNIVRAVADGMKRAGHDAKVFSFGDRRGFGGGGIGILRDIFSFIAAILRAPDCRVVFTTTGYQLIPLSILALAAGRRIYFWEHGDPSFFQLHRSSRLIRKHLYPRAAGVVALHRSFAEVLATFSSAVHVIPNPVPQMTTDRAKFARTGKIAKVVWVGRVSEEKQPELAFDALAQSAAASPGIAHYFICPAGAAAMHSRSHPDNMQVVDGNGFVYSEWLDAESVFLLTSRLEAMPGVVFEALSMGAHIVSTDCSPWIEDIGSFTDLAVISKNATASQIADLITRRIEQYGTQTQHPDRRNELLTKYDQQPVIAEWCALLE